MTCFELLCKTFEGHVKLLNFTNFQMLEYQRNKKFYVNFYPWLKTFFAVILHQFKN